jgi:SAM-dependent methyltransferase
MSHISIRQKIEETFHDKKANQDSKDFYSFGALEEADEQLWDLLGDLTDKRVLEIGCGSGATSIRFAEARAVVISIDISGAMVELTRRRAEEHSVKHKIRAIQMGGEDLDFPDCSFDVVYGHSVLHHLNLEVAIPRIEKVLGTKGIAAFLEPLDHNPILNMFRFLTPHRRTPTERPLTYQQIEELGKHFSSFSHREFYLVSLCAFFWYYVVRSRRLFQLTLKLLHHVDEFLFSIAPVLRRLAWVTVVVFRK